MNPLLIFFVLLFLGAMFLIGEHPEYNPLSSDKQEVTTNSSDVMSNAAKKENEQMGEE